MASPLTAANAYANLARLGNTGGGALSTRVGDSDDAGPSFGNMLKDAMNSVIETSRKSDAQSKQVVNGKANLVDVVTAVSETEVAVDAVVAVRDRVIQAYEDILKMTI